MQLTTLGVGLIAISIGDSGAKDLAAALGKLPLFKVVSRSDVGKEHGMARHAVQMHSSSVEDTVLTAYLWIGAPQDPERIEEYQRLRKVAKFRHQHHIWMKLAQSSGQWR